MSLRIEDALDWSTSERTHSHRMPLLRLRPDTGGSNVTYVRNVAALRGLETLGDFRTPLTLRCGYHDVRFAIARVVSSI